jgi:hypothetical protein
MSFYNSTLVRNGKEPFFSRRKPSIHHYNKRYCLKDFIDPERDINNVDKIPLTGYFKNAGLALLLYWFFIGYWILKKGWISILALLFLKKYFISSSLFPLTRTSICFNIILVASLKI